MLHFGDRQGDRAAEHRGGDLESGGRHQADQHGGPQNQAADTDLGQGGALRRPLGLVEQAVDFRLQIMGDLLDVRRGGVHGDRSLAEGGPIGQVIGQQGMELGLGIGVEPSAVDLEVDLVGPASMQPQATGFLGQDEILLGQAHLQNARRQRVLVGPQIDLGLHRFSRSVEFGAQAVGVGHAQGFLGGGHLGEVGIDGGGAGGHRLERFLVLVGNDFEALHLAQRRGGALGGALHLRRGGGVALIDISGEAGLQRQQIGAEIAGAVAQFTEFRRVMGGGGNTPLTGAVSDGESQQRSQAERGQT